jgi:two-component system NtrC family sensor kinase
MFYSTRLKLIGSFLGVSLLVGTVSLFIGVRLLNEHVLGEAGNRVRLDLNAAGEMYRTRIKYVQISLSITTLGFGFISTLEALNVPELVNRLERMAHLAELDFAGIVTEDGKTLCRIGPNSIPTDESQSENPITRPVIERRIPVSGTVVLEKEFLKAENPELAERAIISLISAKNADPFAGGKETSGMAIGTLVSPEVKMTVLDKGKRWMDRAFVVSDWFITAYEPIEDIAGRRIGMLYVGVLEEKYTDIQRKVLALYSY